MKTALRFLVWLVLVPICVRASVTNLTDKTQFVATTFTLPVSTVVFFNQPADLLVIDSGQTSAPRDPAAVLVLGSDYTLAGGGYNTANQLQPGSLTLVSTNGPSGPGTGQHAVLAGDVVTVMRNVPMTQPLTFTPGQNTLALIEQALDKLTVIDQMQGEQLNRSLQFENFETDGVNNLNANANILQLSSRANSFLAFDPNGNPVYLPTSNIPTTGYVSKIIAGTNVTISSTGSGGTGAVTVNAAGSAGFSGFIQPETYGAVGNGIVLASSAVSISNSTNVLTVTGASFVSGDVGKTITIPGCGPAGTVGGVGYNGNLTTTITAINSSIQVTLGATASHTLTNVAETIIYGHDDTTAFAAAYAALSTAGGGTMFFAANKVYCINPAENTTWITLTQIPVNFEFNGCTIAEMNQYTPASGSNCILWALQGCSPIHIGNVQILGQRMPQQDQTGFTSFDLLEANGVGCSNLVEDAVTQNGGYICFEVFRGPNVQPVSSKSFGLVFSLVNTSGVYYPLELQSSGDSTHANVVANGAFRPVFVFGVKHVHLNVVDVNHNGSTTIACWGSTSGSPIWNDDPYTEDIDLDYTCLAGTYARTTQGENVLIEANGPTPNHFDNIKIRETVFNGTSFPDFILFAAAKLANGSDDTTAGRGHIFQNIDFSASVLNANQGQADLFAFFDSADNPGGGGTGVGNIGNWSGETINNLHVHDVSVQGNSLNTMAFFYTPMTNLLVQNVAFPGGLSQYGSAMSSDQFQNCTFLGASIGALNIIGDGIVLGNPSGGDLGTGTVNVSGNYYINGTPVSGGGGVGSATTKSVTQANSFTLGESLYSNNGTWAAADNVSQPIVSGIVTAATGSNFTVTLSGYENTLTGLTANTQYYLGSSGAYTTTPPTGLTSFVVPLFKTGTTGDGVVQIGAPASNALINVASGGTGVTTLTGIPFGSGASAFSPVTYSGSSITFVSPNLLLSGDSASPGNSMVYGTNGSGTKGWYSGAGGGTVTHTGNLTSNAIVLGNGTADTKVVSPGFTTDGTSVVTLGQSGTSAGGIIFNNTTSGTTEILPSTGALNSTTVTIPNPAGNDILALLGTAQSFTAVQTFTAIPVLGTSGTTAGGLTFENATSGSLTLVPATGALGGAWSITIPNTGTADTLETLGLAQTITAAKTFSASNTFSGTNNNFSGTTSASSSTTGTVTVGNGTAATNVGIGAGNVTAGATVTAAGFSSTGANTFGSTSGATNIGNTSTGALSTWAGTTGPVLTILGNSNTAQAALLEVKNNSVGAAASQGITITGSGSAGSLSLVSSSNGFTGTLVPGGPTGIGAGLYGVSAFPLWIGNNGHLSLTLDTSGNTTVSQNTVLAKTITSYNGVSTQGWGVPAIQGYGRVTAQAAAAAGIASYTVGGADGSFEVSANVNLTAVTTANFTVTCTYTDETNTSRVLTMGFTQLTGATFLTAITNVTGAGPYESPTYHIRAKSSTSITISTAAGGTYTSVTYNAEGVIRQLD